MPGSSGDRGAQTPPPPVSSTSSATTYERKIIVTIKIGNYNFEGPYSNEWQLKDQSGVYAILGGNGSESWKVVDIGESEQLRTRVAGHDRSDSWKRQRHATLACAALYCSAQDRMRVEKELRGQFNPPCGDR
jgi:hypothetical protein